VDKPTALPGEVLTYVIGYVNHGNHPLNTLVINDATPAFTTFVSSTNGLLPQNLTGVTNVSPSAGARGSVQWSFGGSLLPGNSGSVSYKVKIE